MADLSDLQWEAYQSLLTCSKDGKLDYAKSVNLDTRILSFLSSYNFPSPLVEAAHHGHFDIVKYFLEKYGEHIDVNCGAKLSTKLYQVVNNVPPFLAACANDNVEMLEYLVSKGADITKDVPIWGNSLCVAAEYGCISVAKYLLDCHTPVNYTNCKGYSPLLIACIRNIDNSDVIDLLISKGANLYQKTVEGYTAIHCAAFSNEVRHVETLLAHGMSPLFSQADPNDTSYVPCPLYCAADGWEKTMAFLMKLPDCPNICKWEASLIVWHNNYMEMEWEKLENGLRCLEASEVKPIYLNVMASTTYEHRQEMCSKEDLQFIRNTTDNTVLNYQRLLIKERMFGLHDTTIISAIMSYINDSLIRKGKYKEIEFLMQHIMEKCHKQLDLFLCHPQYIDTFRASDVFGLTCDSTIRLLQTIQNSSVVLENLFSYFKFFKDILYKVRPYLIELYRHHVENILIFFHSFINTACGNHGNSVKIYDLPLQFQTIFKELVSDCLSLFEGSSLLHIFFRICDRFSASQPISSVSLMLQCLLTWGSEAINQPNENDKGDRLLHKSVSLSISAFRLPLTEILLSNGAHFDAVNVLGASFITKVNPTDKLFQDICSPYLPLPLSCLTARTIIAEGIEYELVDLPKHMIDFIALHDPKKAMKKPYLDKDFSLWRF